MPEPLHPPYNIVQPRQLNRWLDVNAQNGPLTRTRGFVALPAFNIPAPHTYSYSDIIGVFNYSCNNNFSLRDFDSLTNDGSYTLCISYADSDRTVTRYKLIEGDNDNILFDIPMYNGQVIKKNFRLEIWSGVVNNQEVGATQTATLQMLTTVLGNLDYRYGLDFALDDASAVCTSQDSINGVFPAQPVQTGLIMWMDATSGLTLQPGNKVSNWVDRISGISMVEGTDAQRPTFNAFGNYIQFLSDQLIAGDFTAIGNCPFLQILVQVAVNGANGNPVVGYSTNAFQVFAADGTGKNIVTEFSGNFQTCPTLSTTQFLIIEINTTNATVTCWDVALNSLVGTLAGIGGFTASPGVMIIGNGVIGTGKGFRIKHVLGYSFQPTPDNLITNRSFLFSQGWASANDDMTLPLTFASCTVPNLN